MPQYLVTSLLFDGNLALEWEESSIDSCPDRSNLEKLLLDSYKKRTILNPAEWLLVLGLSDTNVTLSQTLTYWRSFSSSWIHQVRTQPDIEDKRHNIQIAFDNDDGKEFQSKMPIMVGIELADFQFLKDLWDLINTSYCNGIQSFQGSVEDYFIRLAPGETHIDRIHFHLVENRKDEQRPFAFLATYSTRIDKQGRTRHAPLKQAFEEFQNNNSKLLELLSAVHKVAGKNSFVKSIVDTGELFRVIGLTPGEALNFLEGVSEFETAGILCRIPRWWKGTKRKATVSLSVGNNKPSRIDIDAMLDFKPELCIDGEEITEDEALAIIERAEGLVFLKGKWIPVDIDSLQKALDAMQNARKLADLKSISFSDAMRMLMGINTDNKDPLFENSEISCGEWLKSVLEKMADPSLIRTTPPSPELKAQLRPYQQQGLNWLTFMQTLGFGVCLADDMGLGKTVQILAHLQKHKQKGRTSLIVVPSSLLENWRNETEKFTPDLKLVILHPQMINGSIDEYQTRINEFDLAVTTYGMIGRYIWLTETEWHYVICDEAQAIKNPSAKQTKSVKGLKSTNRCIITGTPVENRLTDLWSLFDFINPGLLGSFSEFKTFVKYLDSHPEGFGRIRKVVRPYILRRLKTDKSIIHDLPEKVEMKTWCSLSSQQTIIYNNMVSKLEEELKLVDGIALKGLILTYLIKCKQICNHPDHYAGNGAFKIEESGKFKRLAELCETIHEKRERVLVFTQFAEIINPLASFLEKLFGTSGLTLSGSASVKKRKEAVEKFQSNDYIPFFILSLKAGGVGLNLTNANHVIHFDRWWNPAVENQATDRAFRIGQKKNVMVHKFICKGTIEEKIDLIIEDKKKLAGDIIPEKGESWITELDDRQIREMFKLTIADTDD